MVVVHLPYSYSRAARAAKVFIEFSVHLFLADPLLHQVRSERRGPTPGARGPSTGALCRVSDCNLIRSVSY